MPQPRAWRNFVEHLPTEERHDVLGSYYARLRSPDAAVRDPAVLLGPSLQPPGSIATSGRAACHDCICPVSS